MFEIIDKDGRIVRDKLRVAIERVASYKETHKAEIDELITLGLDIAYAQDEEDVEHTAAQFLMGALFVLANTTLEEKKTC